MTYARRRDENEAGLVVLAREMGAVFVMGPPLDGWLLFRSEWLPVELKREERAGRGDEFTPHRLRFLEVVKVHRGRVLIWRTREDVIKFMGGRVAA